MMECTFVEGAKRQLEAKNRENCRLREKVDELVEELKEQHEEIERLGKYPALVADKALIEQAERQKATIHQQMHDIAYLRGETKRLQAEKMESGLRIAELEKQVPPTCAEVSYWRGVANDRDDAQEECNNLRQRLVARTVEVQRQEATIREQWDEVADRNGELMAAKRKIAELETPAPPMVGARWTAYVKRCQERDEALAACRDLLEALVPYEAYTFGPLRGSMQEAKARACKVLAANITEDG